MLEFSEVIFNITGIYVAKLNGDNSYGTPAFLERGQKVSFEIESDTDEIMAYGLVTEDIAIPKKGTGKLSSAALEFAALEILIGQTAVPTGVSPDRVSDLDVEVGGSGLPNFGMAVEYASTFGGNMLALFPKCKLQTVPAFDVDQNKFRIGEAGFQFYAPSTTIRKLFRLRKQETAAAAPTTAGEFDTIFADFFD